MPDDDRVVQYGLAVPDGARLSREGYVPAVVVAVLLALAVLCVGGFPVLSVDDVAG